jgi:hypothetical protein
MKPRFLYKFIVVWKGLSASIFGVEKVTYLFFARPVIVLSIYCKTILLKEIKYAKSSLNMTELKLHIAI